MGQLTPMMEQYKGIKAQYTDSVLFYRLGDFYEMFFEDAIEASKVLEIALTGRDCGLEEKAPMCGVPYHAASNYISKLIERGYKVAICEQVEDPAISKGIVRREVIRVITPGTVVEEGFLDDKRNNYIMAIIIYNTVIGIASCDVSTGFFSSTMVNCGDVNAVVDEIAKFQPKEIITNINESDNNEIIKMITEKFQVYISNFDEILPTDDVVKQLDNQFDNFSSDLYDNNKWGHYMASSLLLNYLDKTQKTNLNHINKLHMYDTKEYMKIDINTRRNLELTETLREKQKVGSLFWVLDHTTTAMGSRLLRKWTEEPLILLEDIIVRQESIETLCNDILNLEQLRQYLKEIYDIERLIGRISLGTANPRDLIALKNSLYVLPSVKDIIQKYSNGVFKELANIDSLEDIRILIDNSIIDNPPVSAKDGDVIKTGYSPDIDRLKKIRENGKNWIAQQEVSEREKTGIKSVKIGYNKVFGYYIEVTKSNLHNVPDYYIRKQTLANCERYITPELKEMESEILGAEDKLVQLEYDIFCRIRDEIKGYNRRIQRTAVYVSILDCICSLAKVAVVNNYTKPIITKEDVIDIKDGRHPVVEKKLKEALFISNDTYLDNHQNRVCVITGPNMAGKSTYMRQVALLVLMAHIGSFIPCSAAKIALTDRIFTRVGASDDLAQGQSTFMVEMSEVSYIIKNATEKSLIILDEIGRGTSTYDGLSIAWAVIEYITNKEKIGAKTLFATHYHELTELEGKIEGIKNYCISVKERGDEIIFLRKIVRGGADKSYGIHVAKLAGLPDEIIAQAKIILRRLEENDVNNIKNVRASKTSTHPVQINLFSNEHQKFVEKISSIDVTTLTPIEAMNTLYNLVNQSKKL